MHSFITRVFNNTFSSEYNTQLVGGHLEPFYKASSGGNAALICYREDYVSSALHEVAHWCIAGAERLRQDDFGYWYQPDGRSDSQQREFESVEIKPQALEWLFSIAAGVKFRVSADNLATGNKPSDQFCARIQDQALHYLQSGAPKRAGMFIDALAQAPGGTKPLPKHLHLLELAESAE